MKNGRECRIVGLGKLIGKGVVEGMHGYSPYLRFLKMRVLNLKKKTVLLLIFFLLSLIAHP